MKTLIVSFILFPSLVWSKAWLCDAGTDVKVKFKSESETSISVIITKGKKINSCLFNASLPASDPRGASESVIQNFQKVSCSNEKEKFGEGMEVSENAYTKIRLDHQVASFFVFSGRDPLKCKLIK